MHARTFSAVALALTVPAFLTAGPVRADPYPSDRSVCYRNKDKYDDTTRIVLNVKFHSWLSRSQAVFEADGKHSFVDYGKNRMAVFDGAVVTSRGAPYQPKGAHLGGESYWVRGAYPPAPQGGPRNPIEWDCTSADYTATPDVWYCTITYDYKNIPFNLERLPYPDKFCDVFQDTFDYPPPPPPPYPPH